MLSRSKESPISKLKIKSSPVPTNEALPQDLNNDVVEVISLLEEEEYVGDVGGQKLGSGRLSCDKGDIKTLILFEDVDVTLCDDRGFISTIQQLASTGKRPMILTSNSKGLLMKMIYNKLINMHYISEMFFRLFGCELIHSKQFQMKAHCCQTIWKEKKCVSQCHH